MKIRMFAVCAVVFLFCSIAHAGDAIDNQCLDNKGNPINCPSAATTGLVAHWTFDDCTAQDTSGNGNHGTIIGGLTCVIGKLGKAKQFDGSTGYITVPDSPSLNPTNQQCTMSFWINVLEITNYLHPLLHKGGQDPGNAGNREYAVFLTRNLTFHFNSAGDGYGQHFLDSPSISQKQWVHFAGVINRTNHLMQIYVNGKKVAEQADSYSGFNINTHDLFIGWHKEAGSDRSPFKGILDDIRLYNFALSESEIQQLYQNQGECSSELVKFTAGTPAKAADVNANFDAHNCQIQALKAIVCQDHPAASVCQ